MASIFEGKDLTIKYYSEMASKPKRIVDCVTVRIVTTGDEFAHEITFNRVQDGDGELVGIVEAEINGGIALTAEDIVATYYKAAKEFVAQKREVFPRLVVWADKNDVMQDMDMEIG